MVSKKNIPLFDNMKLFLMLFVIIAHTLNNSYGHYSMELIRFYCLCFTMPLFTFISGFLSKPEIALKKDIKHLLLPCLLFTIINDLISWAVIPDYTFTWKRPGFAMWYLWVLFIYRISLPWLIRIPMILPISFVLSWLAGFMPWLDADFQLHRIICFLPWFLLGYYSKKSDFISNKLINVNIGGGKWIVILVAIYLFWTIVIIVHPGLTYDTAFAVPYGNHPIIRFVLRVALQFTAAITGFCFLKIMPNRVTWYTCYGRRTMTAYLLHAMIVLPMAYVIFPFPFAEATLWQKMAMIFVPTICCLPLFSYTVDSMLNRMLGNTKNRCLDKCR